MATGIWTLPGFVHRIKRQLGEGQSSGRVVGGPRVVGSSKQTKELHFLVVVLKGKYVLYMLLCYIMLFYVILYYAILIILYSYIMYHLL